MDNYNEIYPQLPESGDSQNPSDFRLQKSCDALNKIEKELKHYECVRKKYNRVRGIFTKAGIGTATLSVILCGSGITTALTGFGVVVGGHAVAFGLCRVSFRSLHQRMRGQA